MQAAAQSAMTLLFIVPLIAQDDANIYEIHHFFARRNLICVKAKLDFCG
jgi:hypothetical protein